MGNILKVSDSTSYKYRRQASRLVDTRAKAFEAELNAWFLRFARYEAGKAIRMYGPQFSRANVLKAKIGPTVADFKVEPKRRTDDQKLYDSLLDIMLAHGVNMVADNANDVAGETIISPQMARDVANRRLPKVQWFYDWNNGKHARAMDIMTTTKNEVRQIVGSIVSGALHEDTFPSQGEVARRIRNTLYAGPEEGADKATFSFSSQRAALIARTEIGLDQAIGEAEGYIATSVDEDEIEWLAASGPSHRHGSLNGKRITVADAKSGDKSRWFKGPLKLAMRYPKDPMGHIGDIANCECAKRKISAKLKDK